MDQLQHALSRNCWDSAAIESLFLALKTLLSSTLRYLAANVRMHRVKW